MSNALAIAAVTATLRSLISDGIAVDTSISGVSVTTRPPDRARDNNVLNQVNLFLYHSVVNPTWRNMDIPRTVQPGSRDHTPMPLNLYYLVTAYHGAEEDGALVDGRLVGSHRLLGLVVSALHDHAVLDADTINANIPALDRADFPFRQVERVRITSHPISVDELSKLWSGFQSEYRMSLAYEVSLVLIESTRPRRAPLPVLRRGAGDEGVFVIPISTPSLSRLELPDPKPAAELGDALVVHGDNLHAEGLTLRFHHAELSAPLTLSPEADRTQNRLTVQLPDPALDPTLHSTWAPGIYVIEALVSRPSLPPWVSNGLPFGLAPQLTSRSPASAPAGNVTLTVTCIPQIRPDQRVSLLFGDREIPPTSVTTPADPAAETTMVFDVTGAVAGDHILRLRVEGVDSLPVDFAAEPPQFDPNQVVSIT